LFDITRNPNFSFDFRGLFGFLKKCYQLLVALQPNADFISVRAQPTKKHPHITLYSGVSREYKVTRGWSTLRGKTGLKSGVK